MPTKIQRPGLCLRGKLMTGPCYFIYQMPAEGSGRSQPHFVATGKNVYGMFLLFTTSGAGVAVFRYVHIKWSLLC